jgi:mannose-6-phosphate isomerase-like protein (cupin superfamily)
MIIRNREDLASNPKPLHDGVGLCDNRQLYGKQDFDTSLLFLSQTTIPPGSTIGYHTHGENEEMYFILSGRAVMTINGERREVRTGDAILNRRGWSHGLENPFDQPVTILVFLAEMPVPSPTTP